jgi:hypothetical protein
MNNINVRIVGSSMSQHPESLSPKQCLLSRLMSFLLDGEMYVRKRYKDPLMCALQIDEFVTVHAVSKAGRIQRIPGAAITHIDPLLAI